MELHELTRSGLDRILLKHSKQLPETIQNLRWYAIKLAFKKNAIRAIHQARREIDEGLHDYGEDDSGEEKGEIDEETDFRHEEGATPSLEYLSHKMNKVLEALHKSSQKIER